MAEGGHLCGISLHPNSWVGCRGPLNKQTLAWGLLGAQRHIKLPLDLLVLIAGCVMNDSQHLLSIYYVPGTMP